MRLSEWIEESAARYEERARRLEVATTNIGPFATAAFVLFTPRQPYERAVSAWHRWCRTGEVVGARPRQIAAYIEQAVPLTPRLKRFAGEGGLAWTRRLEREVKGLGPVKAPFLACLLEPLARDVEVCLDVWMARHYLGKDTLTPTEAACVQAIHASEAEKRGLAPFPYQWTIWDWKRTAREQSEPLFVNETDIARDLAERRADHA